MTKQAERYSPKRSKRPGRRPASARKDNVSNGPRGSPATVGNRRRTNPGNIGSAFGGRIFKRCPFYIRSWQISYGQLGIAFLAEKLRKIIRVGAEIAIVAFEIEGLHMIVTSAAVGTCDAGSGHEAVLREFQRLEVIGIDPDRKHRQSEEILRGIRQMHGVIEFAGRHADVVQHARALFQPKGPEFPSRCLASSAVPEKGDCRPACFKGAVD
ncbi:MULTISPECIES: hypothetical protein [unclassified Mesorhizobium]|uniref:hypothetical protein n=1 Tax=unclassified Mesorhizobium TaxID=325217 RepID=UPI001FE14DD8|nr:MULTISPECIES: hypothetical protein [unclassified Mesorhizobium]